MSKLLLILSSCFFSSGAALAADTPVTSPSPAVDPAVARGEHNMFHKFYQGAPFFPDGVFENLWVSWEPELKAKAEKMTPEARLQATIERYGLVQAPFENKGYPMGLTPGPGGLYGNCLLCHGGSIQGKSIAGLPGNRFDMQTFVEDAVLTGMILQNQPVPPRPVPVGWQGLSAGTTNAFFFAGTSLSNVDKDMEKLGTPMTGTFGMEGADLDAPPWWNVAKKTWLYSDGSIAAGPRAIMQFGLGTVSGETFRGWLPEFQDIFAWMKTLEAPKYTGPIDPILSDQKHGENIFRETCSGCHGTYTKGAVSYPNKTVAYGTVRTDRQRLSKGLTPEFRTYYGNSWLAEYDIKNVVVKPFGYVAPPLTGVWASAPYFHNGSVPTLYDVLHPLTRPKVWKIKNVDGYDAEKMGLDVERLDQMPADIAYGFEQRRYFNSALPSKGNQGHPFADGLSEPEKAQVLEYLKTL